MTRRSLANCFGEAAAYYDQFAVVQRYAAGQLLQWIRAQTPRVPPGKVLELGCGTGFLSEGLVTTFRDHAVELTDLSPQMVEFCQAKFQSPPFASSPSPVSDAISFAVLDVEQWATAEPREALSDRYSLIASSFMLQWVADPLATIERLSARLHPQGYLCLSFPTQHSFPELRQYCETLGIPCPLNPLPEFTAIVAGLPLLGIPSEFQAHWYSETYPSVKASLQHLKRLGARFGTSESGLSPKDLRQLLQVSDRSGEVTMSYHILSLMIGGNGSGGELGGFGLL